VTLNLEGAPGTTIDLPASGLPGADPAGLLTRLEHRLAELETRKARALADTDHARRQMTHARGSIGQPFPHAGELAAARTRVRDIDEALDRMARDEAKQGGAAAGQEADGASGHRQPDAPRTGPQTDQTRETSAPSGARVSAQREQAHRAAVAANAAYRAGALDQARQFIDQAATLDPSRADLWQQHREQITARRLILDAQAAGAGGDQQQAQRLLSDARQIDPRLPAVWDCDLQRTPPTPPPRHVGPRDASVPWPDGNVKADRSAAREPGTATPSRSGSPVHGDRETPQPSWPSSPPRGDPQPPSAVPQGDRTPSWPQKPAAPAPDTPARPGASADAPDASTEPADSDPATRWPAPNPRAARENGASVQQAKHEEAAKREYSPSQQTHGVAAEPGGAANLERHAPPSADWRDEVLKQARQPWQPTPRWPHHPAMHRPPEADAPDTGIEPRY